MGEHIVADLDLNFLPIYRISGQDLPALPGLQALTPPKRTARGRDRDKLVVFLTLSGNVPLTTSEYNRILRQTTDQFYHTSGSITYALKSAAETANFALLERNLSTTGRGQYVIGLLMLAVLREEQLYLVQSGPTHVFHLSQSETRHLHEPQLSGRGLGLSQTANLYYSQLSLKAGDRLFFSVPLPEGWKQVLLTDPRGSTLEATRRRLVNATADDLNAVLVHVSSGKGELAMLRPARRDLQPAAAHPVPPAVKSAPAPSEALPEEAEAWSETDVEAAPAPEPVEEVPAETLSGIAEQVRPLPTPDAAAGYGSDIPEAAGMPPQPHEMPVEFDNLEQETFAEGMLPRRGRGSVSRRPSQRTRRTAQALVDGMQAIKGAGQRFSQGLGSLLPRLIPGMDSQKPVTLTSSVMGFIAVAIPLIVVTIASVFYLQYGRANQFQAYYEKAALAAQQAANLTEPEPMRVAWESTLFWLDKAEAYQESADSRALRVQAQSELDKMDSILRLDFQPAINNGLPKGIEVARMVTQDTDLYILNSARGNVIRAVQAGRGYDLDQEFRCDPGIYQGFTVGALVDLVALPRGNARGATVMTIDAAGNLLYCAPRRDPQVAPLAPPDTNWNRVSGFTYENGFLYVLDAPARAVWVYTGDDINFTERPLFFFGQQIPQVDTAVDLVINNDQLTMLHSDGHLSSCSYSRFEGVPTRCTNPVVLTDNRPGRSSAPVIPGTSFSQIIFSPPPDSSIFLLEPRNLAIYRFSPRSFELQGQLRAFSGKNNPLPAGTASAIAVSQNHVVFLAVNNQVYFAVDVP